MSLVIIANIEAKKDKIEFIKSELIKLIEPTKAENGCLEYKLQQDDQANQKFMFYEVWQDRECWQQHLQSKHLQNYLAMAENAVENFSVQEMTNVE